MLGLDLPHSMDISSSHSTMSHLGTGEGATTTAIMENADSVVSSDGGSDSSESSSSYYYFENSDDDSDSSEESSLDSFQAKILEHRISTELSGGRKFISHLVGKSLLRSHGSDQQLSVAIQIATAKANHAVELPRRFSDPCQLGQMDHAVQTHSAQALRNHQDHDPAAPRPSDHLKDLLAQHYQISSFPSLSDDELKHFYIPYTDDMVQAYTMEYTSAIRSSDITAIRNYFRSENPSLAPRRILCCNNFGESSVHMACRRGATDILRFMLTHSKSHHHSHKSLLQVRCDMGRTPLHDACWTSQPQFDCIELIIHTCPELLYIRDKRGFLALDYVPRDLWGPWVEFLTSQVERLVPRQWMRSP